MYSYYLPNLMMPFTCGNVFLETQRGVNNHNCPVSDQGAVFLLIVHYGWDNGSNTDVM